MTEEKMILSEIYQLPESLKTEVLHYIEFLKQHHSPTAKAEKPKPRKAGSAKGKYKLAPDFDASLI